jgi:tetratricopeptide (TPR) repeat protein
LGYRNSYRGKKVSRRRKRGVNYRKLGVAVGAAALVVVLGLVIYNHLPFVKVNKAIAAGNKLTESADYEAAIRSYEKAIKIDPKSVAAYSNLAGAYISLGDNEAAKNTLHDGYELTGNELLLRDYHTLKLNEAVGEMNDSATDLSTVETIVSVLEDNADNNDALGLLEAAYDRCFNDSYNYDVNALFRGANCTLEGKRASFSEYSELVGRMLAIYEKAPSEQLGSLIIKYAVPASESFTINTEDAAAYKELLERVKATAGSDAVMDSVISCIENSESVQEIFADIFVQLDVGNVDELRDFVVSDKYLALRDIFLNDQETPQENTTYVSISREAIILNRNEDGFSYRFLSFDEYPETQGVITLWANYFEDDGIQRSSISYEPAAVNGEYFPHTKYSVTYLYSYITSGKSTKVAKMNYRLETNITYEDGSTNATVVGDWGGSNEWVMDIDTIESRIRA